MPINLSPELIQQAAQPYRASGQFAYHFAQGKLSRDPAFAGILRLDLLPAHLRLVDIGCGQGLMASLLAQLPKAAQPLAYTGIELMPKDTARAEAALGAIAPWAQFITGDMCTVPLPECNAVLILDVLHYVPIAAQDALLQRIFEALSPGGRLLLRIGDASGGLGFHVSQWVDTVVTFIRGHRAVPRYCRPLADWMQVLAQIGFKAEAVPMHAGTPFKNILLVAQKS
jgi:SAM-dependent methyltransferase